MPPQARVNVIRSSLMRYAASALARSVDEYLKSCVTRFAAALHESRRREVDRIFRRYRHLIDDSTD